ncbi:MAG: cation:proton antiporter [Candidatus Saganbacteria bacterium]|nr:cation:proton antiporter [Candidatus Saganbacteria bacterium]
MEFSHLLLTLIVILITAKLFGELAQRLGQSPVIGELIGGVIIGGSVLGLVHDSQMIQVFAEIGAILLLFEIGIQTNLYDFLKVGGWAFVVACVGVFFPFLFGYYISTFFGLDMVHSIFIGAILTATSVGITARVFSDLHALASKEARIVLGAAVIDDVIGLAILAVVTRLVLNGNVSFSSVANITMIAVVFLSVSLIAGVLIMPLLFGLLRKMRVRGILFVSAFCFCLLLAYVASADMHLPYIGYFKVGLAPIVGAFIAGLILSITRERVFIEEQIKPLADIFVPVFFVLMGALVDIKVFNPYVPSNAMILQIALWLFIAAVIGKVIAGFSVLDRTSNKLLIGVGMIPRGEVGLIFASMGLTKHIITQPIYSAAVVVIMATTFVTPFLLKLLLKKK